MEEDENAHDRSYNTDLNEKEDRRTEKKTQDIPA